MSQVDGIIIKALDLENHPNNAQRYAVALHCHGELTDTEFAAKRISYYMSGREPPPLPEKMPKLFQIGRAILLPNDQVPPGLNDVAARHTEALKKEGRLKPGDGENLVRAMWISKESSYAVCYCPPLITPEMVTEVARWKRPRSHGEGFTDEQMTTDELSKLFDVRALTEPENRKKLTIMAPIEMGD